MNLPGEDLIDWGRYGHVDVLNIIAPLPGHPFHGRLFIIRVLSFADLRKEPSQVT